jgi:hypothetical protein
MIFERFYGDIDFIYLRPERKTRLLPEPNELSHGIDSTCFLYSIYADSTKIR